MTSHPPLILRLAPYPLPHLPYYKKRLSARHRVMQRAKCASQCFLVCIHISKKKNICHVMSPSPLKLSVGLDRDWRGSMTMVACKK